MSMFQHPYWKSGTCVYVSLKREDSLSNIGYLSMSLYFMHVQYLSLHLSMYSIKYLYVYLSLSVCVYKSHYVPTHMFVCLCIGYHQQSAAFNEEDGRKINIVPLKMISSHPFIASHFLPFIVWVRVYRSTEREKI